MVIKIKVGNLLPALPGPVLFHMFTWLWYERGCRHLQYTLSEPEEKHMIWGKDNKDCNLWQWILTPEGGTEDRCICP